MAKDAKHELVEFLVRKAFNPVLHAKSEGHSGSDERKLQHVQESTRAEIERFRSYGSAEEVLTNFKRDLHSQPAKKIHAELRALHLPTIEDFREEFERKAEELGVSA